ncbi:hypothetical protein [Amycolatopsis sp. NPDC004378]
MDLHEMNVDRLAAAIAAAGLGTTTSVEVITIRGTEVVKVDLDGTSASKARTVLRWLDLITVWDMVAGKFRASDTTLRLNVRGQFPSGGPVVVVVPFDERTEVEQVALITDLVERVEPVVLVNQLVTLES